MSKNEKDSLQNPGGEMGQKEATEPKASPAMQTGSAAMTQAKLQKDVDKKEEKDQLGREYYHSVSYCLFVVNKGITGADADVDGGP